MADVLLNRTFKGHVTSPAPATGSRFSILPAENATGILLKIVQRVPVRIALEGEGAKLDVLRPWLSVSRHRERKRAADEHRSGAVRPAGSVDADDAEDSLRQHVRGRMFIALIDIQIVSAFAAGYRRRLSAGDDETVRTNQLPDRRDHYYPAFRLAGAGHVDALVKPIRFRGGLHADESAVRLGVEHSEMIAFRALQAGGRIDDPCWFSPPPSPFPW